jgi:glycosyltransferase involved in cell wall biosynthesis
MKVLITSKQRPYYGGSATNAYKLTQSLRNSKIKTCCLYFNNDKDIDIDPDNITGVFQASHNSKKKNIMPNSQQTLSKITQYLGGEPTIVLAFNYYVPIISKNVFPDATVVYMVVGSPVLTLGDDSCINNGISCKKFLKNGKFSKSKFYNLEKETIDRSDFILCDHGPLLPITLRKIYNISDRPMKWIDYSSEFITEKSRKKKKKYDLIIVASNWDRKVKNKDLAFQLYQKFPNLNKIAIGKNSNYFKDIPNTTILDLIEHNKLLDIFSESKLLLVTSFFESGPNTVVEALLNNCQVLTSYNIGKTHMLKDYNLCEDVYDIYEWSFKIKYILEHNPKPDIKIKKNQILDILQSLNKASTKTLLQDS